ncbi:MAG: 4-hydroxy-tetrahydrodipicolinate reductase, partial [Acidimicrobiales bacterium]
GSLVGGVVVSSDIGSLASTDTEVAVDFTSAQAATENLLWCAEHGIHAVCGTTGIDEEGLARLSDAFAPADRPNAIVAPNFSVSAVAMMRLAEIAAPLFDSAEIIELHHNHKLDAPSGTSIETARRIAGARSESRAGGFAPDATRTLTLEGARGATGAGEIAIHSVRLTGLVAHQEVIFGAEGQTLTLRQDTYDRSSFMPGVLLAVRKIAATPGFTVGLDELLEL